MKTRAITAFFFTLVMLASFFGGPYVFTGFYLLLSSIALLEFYKLVSSVGIRPEPWLGLVLAVLIFLSTAAYRLGLFDSRYLLLLIPLVFLVFLFELFKKKDNPFAHIGFTFLGLIFVTLPFSLFYSLGFLQGDTRFSFHLPLAFMLFLWANDTGAYLFGMRFGKHKLFERHSPKKSWEGFFGGVLTALLVAWLISLKFTEIHLPVWLGMAALIGCFGTLGDLVESMLKRSLDAKDSGSFLPGHGGFLDRFDGLLMAAPMVYVYLSLLLS